MKQPCLQQPFDCPKIVTNDDSSEEHHTLHYLPVSAGSPTKDDAWKQPTKQKILPSPYSKKDTYPIGPFYVSYPNAISP